MQFTDIITLVVSGGGSVGECGRFWAHYNTGIVNPFTANPVKALHFAILV